MRAYRLVALAGAALAFGPLAPAYECAGVSLRDVAAEVGLDFAHETGARGARHLPETMGSGAAWLDFDDDGDLDLYVVQSGSFPPDASAASTNRLFRNRGDGTFEDATAGSGAGDRGYGQGVLAADLDGDARLDLYVCNYGPDVLLRNRGDGTFEDVTDAAGLGLDGWSSSAAAADADRDGDLDLYVTRYVEYDLEDPVFCGDVAAGRREYCVPTLFLGATDRFYRNDGDGTFTDASAAAGIAPADGRGLGVAFTDLDGDRFPDLYVANDLSINLLYRNRGDGTFEGRSLISGAGVNVRGDVEAGMGVAVGDIDGDADPDLLVTNFDVETNTLYRNLGAMRFEDVSASSGFGVPSFNLLGFGIALRDLDRDGDLDAYVANGHIHPEPKREGVRYAQPDLLLLGDGRGGFRATACGPAFESPTVGRGVAAGDPDDDGDVDLAIVVSGGPLQLLRNEASGGAWIGVQPVGRAPNRQAIGARVTLVGSQASQVRRVAAGGSYQSSADRRVLFGLRPGETVRRIEVTWPSGAGSTVEAPATGRYHEIHEDGAAPSPDRRERGSPGKLRAPLIGALIGAVVAALVVLRLASRRRR